MEAFFLKALAEGLVAGGLPAMLLAFAVYWQTRAQARSESRVESTIERWQTDVRVLFEKRITDLERRSESCEADRDEMRKMIWNHLEGQAMDCKSCTHFNPKSPKPATNS